MKEVALRPDSVIAIVLACALLAPPPSWSQEKPPVSPLVASQAGTLKVVVLEGEGAKNNIRSRTGTAPVVEVRDESDKPVAGAEVVFQLPSSGPGGIFHGWMRAQTVRSDAQGRAGTSGFAPNEEEGRFNIKVTATAGTKTGSVVIAQSNVRNGTGAQARPSRKRLWTALGIIGVGAIVGGAVAARNGDTPAAATPSNPVIITPGAVSVGGPR